jgi:hypothetical protein
MADTPQPLPPLLPVIPEYKPWLDRVINETAADAAVADAGFAVRHGPVSGPESPAKAQPELSRGALADETA